jgi:hypothetical protein
MAQTSPKYSLVQCRDLEERHFRKEYSKGVTLSRPLCHFCKKSFFSVFRLKTPKKFSKVERLEKKFILGHLPKILTVKYTLQIEFSLKFDLNFPQGN